MSTRAATVQGAAPAPPSGRRASGSSLTRNWHGLPVWAWVLGGTVVGYLVWTKVLHKSSATAAAPAASAAAATTATAGAGGAVTTGGPTGGGGGGGGYTAGAGSGAPLGTAPAAPAKTPVAGTFQAAPTGSVFAATGHVYSPISTWKQTLAEAAKGIQVFLRTTQTGQAYPVTLAQLKQIEHTGTHKFPQYVVYTQTTGTTGAVSSSAVTTPKSSPTTIPTTLGTATVVQTRSGRIAAVPTSYGTAYPNTAATRTALGKTP